jgi:hypothetical protein
VLRFELQLTSNRGLDIKNVVPVDEYTQVRLSQSAQMRGCGSL